ncbi:hypothetical protein [Burkholderia ambifaria]|uniref:hypothetical protein n=1 Tax=Burkholderia ambifaria TaxID=152480 RepID=UPI00158895F0|nr:hypothetical protein [Burkholderia ambifaria]MBR8342117.1 hypothetical protein [Burkholderia ambifaria]
MSHATAVCAVAAADARGPLRLRLRGVVRRRREPRETVAHGRFRGVRRLSTWDADPSLAFKRLTAHASPNERDALFRGTVSHVYRLG